MDPIIEVFKEPGRSRTTVPTLLYSPMTMEIYRIATMLEVDYEIGQRKKDDH